MKRYVVRRADITDALTQAALRELALACFPKGTLRESYKPDSGVLWLVWHKNDAIAFSQLQVMRYGNTAYVALQGVLPEHRGHGLQRRLLRVAERYARSLGLDFVVTETIIDNPISSNNLIRSGFELFTPDVAWNPKQPALYWRKAIA